MRGPGAASATTSPATAARGTSGRRSSCRRARRPGAARIPTGASGRSRRPSWACCPARPRRQGHHRTRLRHRVRLGVDGSTRRPAGRHRPLGANSSPTARRLQEEHGLDFPLHEGNAEELPFPDASFDLAISEYGASIWADPYRWIPEAARVLRPGGRAHLPGRTARYAMLVRPRRRRRPDRRRLQQDYFGMHRFEWPDWPLRRVPPRPTATWIRLLRANGFEIEDLIEVRPAEDAELFTELTDMTSLAWSRRWPCEEIWKARKTIT